MTVTPADSTSTRTRTNTNTNTKAMSRWLRSFGPAVAVLALCFLAYAWDGQQTTAVLRATLTFATPLILCALTGLLCERSGVVNIGIEGQLLAGAFTSFFVSSTFGVFWGTIAGIATGAVLGLGLSVAAVIFKVDQIIAGTVITILCVGLTSFLYQQGKTIKGRMPEIKIPGLSKLPLIGDLLFSNQVITYLAIVAVVVVHVMLFSTRWGLRTRAVGEHPSSADTAGINVNRLRLVNVAIAGGFAGLGGAFLSLQNASTFSRGMSANLGFLALALMITGRWRPYLAAGAALFFGLFKGVAAQLQFKDVVNIPPQFVNALPYALTLVALTIFSTKVRPPAAAGVPYEHEG
jgi:general nucleoside transport system permease protein